MGILDPGNSREYRPPIPVPKDGNGSFHSHSRVRKREWNFHYRSHSRKLGMELVIPVHVTGNGTSKSVIENILKVGKKRSFTDFVMPFLYPFPGIPGILSSNSRSESRELLFPFQKIGLEFSTWIPVPEKWEWICHLPIPVPEVQK